MKITIYTISNDPFCTSEKEYLTAKALQFEEKNLETNREFLAEMMTASDNFAGVPFTIIVKDDGTTVKLRGFTKEEFDGALSTDASATAPMANTASTPTVVPTATNDPVGMPTPLSSTTPSTVDATASTPARQKELEGVLNTLSSMSTPVTAAANPAPVASVVPDQSAAPMQPIAPTITDTSAPVATVPPVANVQGLPTIPDFTQTAS